MNNNEVIMAQSLVDGVPSSVPNKIFGGPDGTLKELIEFSNIAMISIYYKSGYQIDYWTETNDNGITD